MIFMFAVGFQKNNDDDNNYNKDGNGNNYDGSINNALSSTPCSSRSDSFRKKYCHIQDFYLYLLDLRKSSSSNKP